MSETVGTPARTDTERVMRRGGRKVGSDRSVNPFCGDDIRGFLQQAAGYERLTPGQEIELGRRYRDDGDMEAFRILIHSNLSLVVSVAKRYRNRGMVHVAGVEPFRDALEDGHAVVVVLRAVYFRQDGTGRGALWPRQR